MALKNFSLRMPSKVMGIIQLSLSVYITVIEPTFFKEITVTVTRGSTTDHEVKTSARRTRYRTHGAGCATNLPISVGTAGLLHRFMIR